MIIPLSKTERIDADDGKCFALQRLRAATEKRPEAWVNEGYYATLAQACRAAIDKGVLGWKGEADARAVAKSIEAAGECIAQACEYAFTAAQAAEYVGVAEAPADLPDVLFAEDFA